MGIEFIITYVCSFLVIDWLSKLIASPKERVNFQIVACFVLLAIFFCCRDLPVLNDTSHYYRSQYALASKDPSSITIFDTYNPNDHYEYFFQCWTRFIAKYIWADGYAIIFITSLLVTIANLWFLKKYTSRVALAVFLLFMYIAFMNAANRQAYAIMLFYIAFQYLRQGKLIKYLLLIGIAYFFHSSAVILFALPLFRYLRFKASNVTWLFLISIVIAICLYPIMETIGYEDDFYVTQNAMRERLPLAQILNFAFSGSMLLAIWYIRKKYNIANQDHWIAWMAVLCVVWELIAIPLLIFGRFASYFRIFVVIELLQCAYTAKSLKNCTGTTRSAISPKWILGLCIAATLARMIVVVMYRNEWMHLVPYEFFDFKAGYHNCYFGY